MRAQAKVQQLRRKVGGWCVACVCVCAAAGGMSHCAALYGRGGEVVVGMGISF